nr:ATP-binding protein [Variovorax sp. dw_954]
MPGGKLAWPHLGQRTSLLQGVLRSALRHGEPGVNILIYGAPGTGKTEYARQLVQEAEAQGFGIDDTDSQQRPASRDERLGSLRLSEIFAPQGHSVLVLDEAEDIFQSDYTSPLRRLMGHREESKSWMNQRLESNRIPVIWISNQIDHIDPAYLRRFTYCLEFLVPPRAQRREIAREHLSHVGASDRLIDRAAGHPTLPAAVLASAARFATLSGAAPAQVDNAIGQMLADHLQAMGQPFKAAVVDSATRFDLAYLNVNGKTQPAPLIAGLAKLGRGSVLLCGAPGTGKTQLASEIARALGRDLIYRTAADINSKWYGESERNVADLFTQCDPQGEVLFLDEADTLLGDRSSTGHRADQAVTAEFLRRVEAFEGVFICATNHANAFDPALMRRFVFRLELLPLAHHQREALFIECLRGSSSQQDVVANPPLATQLARLRRLDQLTPGDFANVFRRFEALGVSADVSNWLDELEAEHHAKPQSSRGAMGFV